MQWRYHGMGNGANVASPPPPSAHCDHTMHVSADLSVWLDEDTPVFWAPWHQSMPINSQSSFFSPTCKRGGVWMCKLYAKN